MKHIRLSAALPALALALALAGPAAAQDSTGLKVNGYFSFDILRGPSGLPASAWSVANLRGGLIFSGTLTPGLVFILEPTFAQGEAVGLTEARAGLAVAKGVSVTAGLFLVPFGKYNRSRRPHETALISDPPAVGTVYPVNWREMGIEAEASFGNFNAAVFAGNGLAEGADFGAGQQFSDNNKNKGWGGRLGAALSASLEVGGSYYRGKADAANERAVTMVGADASWRTENIRASGEYARATIENPAPFSRGTAEGWFGAVELHWGSWIPVVSYRRFRAEDPFHGPGFAGPDTPGAGFSRNGTQWALGLVYSPAPSIFIKVEVDRGREQGGDAWQSTFRAQAAFYF